MEYLRIVGLACLCCGVSCRGSVQPSQPSSTPSAPKQAAPKYEAAKPFTNSIAMAMVPIPSGEFYMGADLPAAELVQRYPEAHQKPESIADEYPRHLVRITQGFYLGATEVTVGQYRRFVDATGYLTEAETDGKGGWGYDSTAQRCRGRDQVFNWRSPGYRQTDGYPIVDVTYNDAQAFCAWLSKSEARHYRLPTEAEWEYAHRAGTTTLYAFGNEPLEVASAARMIDPSRFAEFGHVQELAIAPNDATAFPLPVASFRPNGFGLYDTHGNVWEWVADWYGENYYAESPVQDPKGPPTGEVRVRRGGGWNSFPIWIRSSFRNWNLPDSRCVNLGFRVALDTQ